MTPRTISLLLALLLSGCAVIFETASDKGVSPQAKIKELVNISQLRLGMSASEVKALLGEQVKVGYQKKEDGQTIESIFLKNPVKEETIEVNQQSYYVQYYYTTIRKADDILADDELTPLIFQKDKLVGIGRDYLLKLKGASVK